MTKDEYTKELLKIEVDYKESKRFLNKEYASSNNTYNIDDVVTDHIGSVLIKQIRVSQLMSEDGFPLCAYIGLELTKAGKPKKNEAVRNVWGGNVLKKIT